MVSEYIRSYNSLPAKASDRLGLTAEACREVTIFARHEKVLKLFTSVYVFFMISGEFPRASNLISIIKHSSSLRL